MSRPPLTDKRKKAIHEYVYHRARTRGGFVENVVNDTLKAERMPANVLYEWLRRKGYKWDSRGGYWKVTRKA